MTRLKIAMNR
ncbi:unnamed protein product [Acanthoscelides obtectus]|uniref:Uncharacterized protein n=1 Tax=Acanthoscelides obtectus TaxID=200917 RepID=A0A9P0PFS6_ACAOB|nr:unnamed protein product [Acanthoscelides obtectus]CAK1650910.1 hypothetical protein AOBTE_LOCUS16966 [Acanthoscelides obtectus]